MFREWNYPNAEEHAQKHMQILIELGSIIENIQGTAESEWIGAGLKVKRILTKHLLNEDMKYRDYCKENNLCSPV